MCFIHVLKIARRTVYRNTIHVQRWCEIQSEKVKLYRLKNLRLTMEKVK